LGLIRAITGLLGNAVGLVTSLIGLAAWVTHVVICIQAQAWILLVIGVVFFPVGVVHGFMIWLGIPWM
jgi:hypothetical protein